MCRVDDSERADVYCTDNRIARVGHRCGECRRDILAGEPYAHHTLIYDGFASTHDVCSHCTVLAEWLGRECGGSVSGEVIEEIEEHATEYGRADLAELALEARGQWCWSEGTRCNGYRGKPIPAPPGSIEIRS
jgi:hypothetical protein